MVHITRRLKRSAGTIFGEKAKVMFTTAQSCGGMFLCITAGEFMTDEELITQSPTLPTMYFDGFGAYQRMNGVLRCIGYVLQTGANLNLVVSISGADQASVDTARTLRAEPVTGDQVWRGAKLAH